MVGLMTAIFLVNSFAGGKKVNTSRLSQYTHAVVVDQWEQDAMNHEDLHEIYQDIFSHPAGNDGQFYTQEQWDKLDLGVPYVAYDDNPKAWHYSAKFIQEMVNVIRMNNLQKRFVVSNEDHLKMSSSGEFSGWITSFRMFLSNPTVRNVWEQYKYRHGSPHLTAWVKYFVIEPVENNPEFFKAHQEQWDRDVNDILKG